MSFEDQKDVNISELPYGPPPLTRTLSEQHWIAAKLEMAQKKRTVQWAGSQGSWEYQLVRKTTRDKDILKQSFCSDGNMVYEDQDKLPKATRCEGFNKDGSRCKRKVYWVYCRDHAAFTN